jgi:hypothetical protein
MTSRSKVWHVIAALGLLFAAAVGLFEWRKSRAEYDAPYLLNTLPLEHAVRVYVDVGALRYGGLLDSVAGSNTAEEPEYRKFVQDTGFDYRKDLDAAAAAFGSGNTYMSVRGRFDWNRLQAYARSQGGSCTDTVCWMAGSQPNRYISYRLLHGNVLGLALSPDQHAAEKIRPSGAQTTTSVPSSAIWVSAPGEAFNDLSGLPDGSHILSPLADAKEVTFDVTEKEIRVDAACASPEVAVKVVERFTATTNLLRSMLQREKKTPSSADLSGVLVAGHFQTQASHALGTWPIEKKFVESLFSSAAP